MHSDYPCGAAKAASGAPSFAFAGTRAYQIGYLSADRCGWVGGKIRQGQDVRAIFQQATRDGAVIRVHLDGQDPTLPPPPPEPVAPEPGAALYEGDPDSVFWPDYIPPDA